MSTWTIRPMRIPDDFERVAAIQSAYTTEPVTVAELRENEQKPNGLQYRVVAEDPAGFVAGYGLVRHHPFEQPGHYYVKVFVDPARTGTGAGRLLCRAVEDWAAAHGAEELETGIRDNQPEVIAFAQRRGYAIFQHVFESTLDPAAFDEAPFAGVVAAAKAAGIRFFTLADETSEAAERQLYDLYARCAPDIPAYRLAHYPAFADWRQWMFEGESTRRDCMIVAADAERFIGCTVAEYVQASGTLYTDFTCVDREYRGRHLALALKLLSIRTARKLGVPCLRTNNDSNNGPMLAINRRLGYLPAPGMYFMQRKLTQQNE